MEKPGTPAVTPRPPAESHSGPSSKSGNGHPRMNVGGSRLSTPGAITQLGGLLAKDPERNRQIAADIAAALAQGRKCLVLSRRRDHLTALAGLLPDTEVLIMRGGTGAKAVAAIRAKIADASPGDPLLVMTTIPLRR